MIQTSRRDDAIIRRITADAAQLEEQAAMLHGEADVDEEAKREDPQDTLEKSHETLPPSPPTPPPEVEEEAGVEKTKNDDKGNS